MLNAYKNYYNYYSKRNIKPYPIWKSFGSWYNSTVKFTNKKILDFGCSVDSNCYNKFLLDNSSGRLDGYWGYDIDNKTIQWLRKKKIFYNFWKNDTLRNKFDIINASEVYEHLDEKTKEEFILRSLELLNKNGFLLLDFPYINNLNIIEFFHGDRTHKPISCEDEAVYIRSLGFKTVETYIGGLTWPYLSFFHNIRYFLLNIFMGFYPFHITVIIARKS